MKVKLVVILVSIALAVGVLLVSTASEASHPHYKLHEFAQIYMSEPGKLDNRFMTLYGKVKEGSIYKKGITADFVIVDEGHEMKVHFTGKTLLPDTFKDGADAAVDGHYDPQSGRFIAQSVLAKCASKYEGVGNSTQMKHPDSIRKY